MGQALIGIISNQLTPEEIVILPERLNKDKPLGIQEEQWRWETEGVSVDFLEEYWTRDEEWYVNELKNKRYDRIYKYPGIATTQLWSIRFFERNLMEISLPLKYFSKVSEDPRIDTLNMAIRFAKYFGQNAMVLTHEFGSGGKDEDVKYDTLSNMVDSFKLTNRDFRKIEF